MISNKPSVQLLIKTLKDHHVQDIVISPGSRNAPLIISFGNDDYFKCHQVVDERSAAFVALGLSKRTTRPVVLCCTSGSAMLNYAPAIAEAYYSKRSLIILSADRPKEWIDQYDNQTIRQMGVYSNFIREEMCLEEDLKKTDQMWFMHRELSKCINASKGPVPGPVHINCHFSEPLYDQQQESNVPEFPIMHSPQPLKALSLEQIEYAATQVNDTPRVMILLGSGVYSEELGSLLEQFKKRHEGVVILSEGLHNLKLEGVIAQPDLLFPHILEDELNELRPELLISIGDTFVSKSLKMFLRKNPPLTHWRIDPHSEAVDTFQHLDCLFSMEADAFFESILPVSCYERNSYSSAWSEFYQKQMQKFAEAAQQVGWSDAAAMNILMQQLPEDTDLHLGNSSIVRYALQLNNSQNLNLYTNRGTSGIEGSLSTAIGCALSTDKTVSVILGDLSFMYDSNALWIKDLPTNLRVIVINNGGGEIFNFIPGPSTSKQCEDFFVAPHHHSIIPMAKPFGWKVFSASNQHELLIILQEFYKKSNQPCILELDTSKADNASIWKILLGKTL